MVGFFAVSLVTLSILASPIVSLPSYLSQRGELLAEDLSFATGSQIQLSGKEWAVNDVLMRIKEAEIRVGTESSVYPPAVHFFQAKPQIDQSEIFQIIKMMPKGAVLHVHADSIVGADWLIKNATYRPHCYLCFTKSKGIVLFRFRQEKPADDDECEWKLVAAERSASGDTDAFDQMLYNATTLIVDDPGSTYEDQKHIWKYFKDYFTSKYDLFYFSDVIEDGYYEGLTEFYDDGVQFVEFRSYLSQIYDIDGTTYDSEYTLNKFQAVNDAFVAEHEDFIGSKIIYAQARSNDKEAMKLIIEYAMELYQKYPDFLAGFDLDDNENQNNPLVEFWEELLIPAQRGVDLPYFFHASETNWQGTFADDNLFDALLLNSTRIGHGYGAIKHPAVLKRLKERDIPIEVCPISGQVLMHFNDLRNHPAAHLLAHGYPVVIASDNRACWGASPISHDYYEAFMGIASAKADLRLLKQLTRDSIRYSTLNNKQKQKCMDIWSSKWDEFLDNVLTLHNVTDWEDYVPSEEPTVADGTCLKDTGHTVIAFIVLFSLLIRQ